MPQSKAGAAEMSRLLATGKATQHQHLDLACGPQQPRLSSALRDFRELVAATACPASIRSICLLFIVCLPLLLTGCGGDKPNQQVVVYTALDAMFSDPILKQFEQETGIRVLPKYDTESTKTVGLVNTIRSEAKRPRCDVFWNNEIINTIALKDEGLLDVYRSPAAAAFPEPFRDKDGYWTGFAARARVLLVNTDLVKPEEMPDSIADLTDPRWKGKTGIAKPLFGTTASHAACLFAERGDEEASAYFEALRANDVQVQSGNKQVAQNVSAGVLAFGLTDTDDAIIEVEAGKPVTIVYPDGGADQDGVLFIPNTLALIKGTPNPEAARKLIDYLLSPAVETALARGSSAQIPVNPAVTEGARVKTPNDVNIEKTFLK
jgi:iron(III) transport system substrate-binding protein